MKLPVVLLALSVTANLVLAGLFVVRPAAAPPAIRDWFNADAIAAEAAEAKQREARAAARRVQAEKARAKASESQLWSALQSDDLKGMIDKLQAAGFPSHLIRAIVAAQVQARFAARMNEVMRTVQETPYWRAASISSIYNPRFHEERQQIYRERSRAMRELLGHDIYAFHSGDPTAVQRRQFGNLSQAKIDLIQRINDDYAEMVSQIRAESQGITLPEDREKLALLEREKRADLAAILTPQELEDYEMRSSQTAMRLRSAMTFMNASEDEFRTIFRVQQKYAEQLYPMSAGVFTPSTSESMQQRREATNQMNAEIKAALGESRSTDFLRASNYDFQQLAQFAQRENRPMADAIRAYDLRETAARESQRIGSDASLSNDQKRAALATLAQNTKVQLSSALGPVVGGAYAESARWLQAIERGSIVTFDGTSTSFRPITSSNPPPRN